MKKIIPFWFRDKNSIYDSEIYDEEIIRETEKAVLVKVHCFDFSRSDENYLDKWIPKSILMTEEEFEAYLKEEEEKDKARKENMAKGLERNQYLKELALANGIKGIRERNTTKTLEKKLAAAGVAF